MSGRPRAAESAYIDPSASIIGDVTIGEQSSIWPGAVLRADLAAIHVGRMSNVQDNVVIHADPGQPCIVGDRVSIGHGAVLHGCTIEDDCLVGIGAVVLNGARVGRGTVIAAGGLVPESTVVPPASLLIGVPGRIRPLPDDRLPARAETSWRTYVQLAEEARARTGRAVDS